jgi:hypothetical protein
MENLLNLGEEMMNTFTIRRRRQIEVNTDPQRRCYNGCHAKSEMQWTAWDDLNINVPVDRVDNKLKFWRELNDYAVSQRGEGARCEFEAVKEEEPK